MIATDAFFGEQWNNKVVKSKSVSKESKGTLTNLVKGKYTVKLLE